MHFEDGLSNSSKSVDRQRFTFSVECHLCTGIALFVLVCLHTLLLYELSDIVVSIYITVLTPLFSIFYNVSHETQLYLYTLNVSAVVVIALNLRYKRNFSFLFLVILSVIQLHVLFNLTVNKRREDSRALSDQRICFFICTLLVCNGIVIHFLWQRSQAREYNPQEHGLQALMIFLNVCMYIHAPGIYTDRLT